MTAVRAIVLLAFCAAGAAALAQDDIVDWRDAAQCVGRVCGLRGTVVATENDGPTIRLYFDAEQRDVRVLLMRAWLVTWPSYEGATIVATGKVDRFRDHVEAIVLDPSNVTVLSAATAATTTTPVAASPSELDELRHKVRELEDRIRELEGR
jgi:hypothetical protein